MSGKLEPSQPTGREPQIGASVVGPLVMFSIGWITACLAIWLVPPVFTFGGFALTTVFWVVLGPPLGLVASLAIVFAVWALRRYLNPMLTTLAACALGWSAAFLVWLLLGFASLSESGLALSGVVAVVGFVVSAFIIRLGGHEIRLAGPRKN